MRCLRIQTEPYLYIETLLYAYNILLSIYSSFCEASIHLALGVNYPPATSSP
jgi:hypothetical protein